MAWRIERIAQQLRDEVSRVIRDEVRDPRIPDLTVTRVVVAPDLSTARVFWSPLDIEAEIDDEEVQEGLDRAAPFMRGKVASVVALRKMPAFHFRRDDSIEKGADTLAIMRTLPEIDGDR
jgi:ribosome-binding factor A